MGPSNGRLGGALPQRPARPVRPVRGAADDYDDLIELVGDKRFVLIGEASHGTHDFYRERARITQRLIDEKEFTAVAVEADWPDSYRVNRWVRGQSEDQNPREALTDFQRFPAWMWRNQDVAGFLRWLRVRNDSQHYDEAKVGFYGLDLYSLRASMDAVVGYLERVDPLAAAEARERYGCFDLVSGEGQRYGHAVTLNLAAPCEDEVVAELADIRRRRQELLAQDGWLAVDEFFFAEQNARLVLNAERYYRQMYRGNVSSWNLRDTHMGETLAELAEHLGTRRKSKIVVWAHNSHVGDARSTQMGWHGELNIGQLVRERHPDDCVLVGFTTHQGTVTAASEWGGSAERKRVRPSLADSYERLFHDWCDHVGHGTFSLATADHPEIPADLLERAIGVIYRPDTERASHWFHADLPRQFDYLIHIDLTSALQPLEKTPMWQMGEPLETYPSGF
ncbi:MAG: erythromycin esterase family protein [Candidatus Nanopelagicales bacterium]|nr:erythromycin esterase family protein [Candidatus Nanopelagicales bacterium]